MIWPVRHQLIWCKSKLKGQTEGKAYSVTVRLKEDREHSRLFTRSLMMQTAVHGSWSFSKDGYNLNATSGADKLTKENAKGEETLELLSGNDLPTRADHDF